MSTEGSTKAVVAALLANTGIAVLKFIAWALTGSASMLAEAIHSVADSGNQGLLLLGGSRAKRAATAEHPFGFGRERYIYSFLVAIVLFSVGGLFALYEAYHKIREVSSGHHDELLTSRWWWVPLVVLVGAIAMEGFSFRTAISEAEPLRGSVSWVAFVRQARSPELPVILLEDFAALVGLVFALFGVTLTKLTGNGYFDAAGTAAIGLLLVAVAIVLGVETKSLLVGESASPAVQERIATALAATPGVVGVVHLETLHLGPEELLVGARVSIDGAGTAESVAATMADAETAVRAAEPTARVVYVAPAVG